MKTVFLDCHACPHSQLVYLAYFVYCATKTTQLQLKIHCSNALKQALISAGICEPIVWTDAASDASIRYCWDPQSNIALQVQQMCLDLGCELLHAHDVVQKFTQSDALRVLTQRRADRDKTVVAIFLPEFSENTRFWSMFSGFLKKICETEAFYVIVVDPGGLNQDANTWLIAPGIERYCCVETQVLNFAQSLQLVANVDVIIAMNNTVEAMAALLKKPVLICIDEGAGALWQSEPAYIGVMPLLSGRNDLIEQAYLTFTDLIYNWNLNVPIEQEIIEQWKILLKKPVAVVMNLQDDYASWAELNGAYVRFVHQLAITGKQAFIKELQKRQVSCVVGQVGFWTKISIGILNWIENRKPVRWVSTPVHSDISFEHWVSACLETEKENLVEVTS